MNTDFTNKKIGIWGFGTVGKSVLSFLHRYGVSLTVLDNKRDLTDLEHKLIQEKDAQLVDGAYLAQFLEMNDIIIPSPGVSIPPTYFEEYRDKWLSELDLFAQFVRIPTIAVTGSAGKTTVVHTLTHCLNKLGKKVCATGNIGYPLLEAVLKQDTYDYFVIELSSFQLQYNQTFAPDIALLTNLYENHLDQHEDMYEYVQAKGQIFAHQTEQQLALIPMEWMDICYNFIQHQKVIFIADDAYENITKVLYDIIHPNNLQLICATLESLDLPLQNIGQIIASTPPLEHRYEKVASHKGITFINDSKSTLVQATQQALERTEGKKVLLILGGISKGVDRQPLIESLSKNVTHVSCFGVQAEELGSWCEQNQISYSTHRTLDSVFKNLNTVTKNIDIVLFSPSGASFDLYNNYIERGKEFKKLVSNLCKHSTPSESKRSL